MRKRCAAALPYPSPSVSLNLSFWWFPRLILDDSWCAGVSRSNRDFGLLPSQLLASEDENLPFYTQSHAPFTLNGSFCILTARGAVPRELVLGPGLWNNWGLWRTAQGMPSLNKCLVNSVWSLMFTQCCSSPAWMFTFPLVFHRDWWKQKPKLFPWRMHPSCQRVPYRKGTGYGSATWIPKSQSKSKSSWFIIYQ